MLGISGLGLRGLSHKSKGIPAAVIQTLLNGASTPTSLTTGPLWVRDYLDQLVSAGADRLAVPGMRLATTVAEGATLGPELNPGFASWNRPSALSVVDGALVSSGTASTSYFDASAVGGKSYQITMVVGSVDSGAASAVISGAIGAPRSAPGTYTEVLIATGSTANAGVTPAPTFRGTITSFSVREVTPKFVPTDTEGTALYPSQQVRTRNGTVTQYTGDYKGMQVAPAMTNKVTARKVNPVDTTNVTKAGDAAAVLSVVDDSAALAAAGLDKICTSGMVYKLDNSAGSVRAYAVFSGVTGNTNNHSLSLYSRNGGVGSPNIYFSTVDKNAEIPNTAYEQIKLQASTPTDNNHKLGVYCDSGEEAYFILPELIESPYLLDSPVVPLPADDALTSYTRAATVAEFSSTGRLREQNCAVWGRVIPSAGGQTGFPFVFSSYVSGTDNIFITPYADAGVVRAAKKLDNINNQVEINWSYAKDTPFEYQAFWSTSGIGVRLKEDGGAWSAWATNANTDPAPIADTFQIGSRNGANQFAGSYPFTATAFLPTQATLADYQNWIETNEKWNVLGGEA